MRTAYLVAAAISFSAPAKAQLAGSLVEATLTQVEDVSDMPNAPRLCVDADCTIILDGSFRTTFKINRLLAGPKAHGTVSTIQASAKPRTGLRYYLVVLPFQDGPKIEWAGLKRHGLCIDPSDAARFGLRAELERFPCRAD